ncbi:hypothetical protein SJX93_16240 [Streptomyces cyaneofuscatus]|nr:hypothetical protein [Streptomyces cyaneofuscatus]WRO11059.1 hypothetical protein SJX93_16240 [Streptomyces cyaneofuscatus]
MLRTESLTPRLSRTRENSMLSTAASMAQIYSRFGAWITAS